MHPPDCPKNWDYESDANDALLRERCRQLLERLRTGQIDHLSVVRDSRPPHGELFAGMTSVGHEYFAGNYRGSEFRCLRHYEVGIKSDDLVGTRASLVAVQMTVFVTTTLSAIGAHDAAAKLPNAQLPAKDRFQYLVWTICEILCEFLRIHPYANGNGHVSRLIVWVILARFGYWPKRWPFEERPPDPPYSGCLSAYRRGNKAPLEDFVYKCIKGT